MNKEKINEIMHLVKDLNLSKVKIESEDLNLLVENNNQKIKETMKENKNVSLDDSNNHYESTGSDNFLDILSPMVGIYYESPSPDDDPYIKVGDSIKNGSIVANIEAMKILTEVISDKSGTIEEILVNNGEIVEYRQPLIRIKI